ncbi:MAG: hypothetical protein K1W04_01640 [Oscillospiraceae bacterium]
MLKGFIAFGGGKIPFVVENYRMDLFSNDNLLQAFAKEYNFKHNYILEGQCFMNGFQGQKAIFLVEQSMGETCYLHCYIIYMLAAQDEFDTIGLQSSFLDDIFRYNYNYLDGVRTGINFAVEPKDIYQIPFSMDGYQYNMSFRIGHNNQIGLLEDLDRKGELLIPLHTNKIHECNNISIVFYRLAMFMMSQADVPFKQITLYKQGKKVGWFYCPLISKEAISSSDIFYYKFDVMKYIPTILNNIALDSGNKITQSIPLGHIGNIDTVFSPQRFIEQVMAFEYLFDKLEHKKAQNTRFSLKEELKYSFNLFPKLLTKTELSADDISEEIKETRRTITHGYVYYYDFKDDQKMKYLIMLFDKLIRNMSLRWMGFSTEDIDSAHWTE